MKFLIDMNLSPLWVAFLADRGFEAIRWSTVGQPGAADSEIFDLAAVCGQWLDRFHARPGFRHDLDFGTTWISV